MSDIENLVANNRLNYINNFAELTNIIQGDNLKTASKTEPLIVVFSTTWCPPCKALVPILEEFATNSSIRVYKVNVDELGANYPIALSEYGIRAFPTTVIFYNGIEESRKSGYMNLSAFTKFAEQAITSIYESIMKIDADIEQEPNNYTANKTSANQSTLWQMLVSSYSAVQAGISLGVNYLNQLINYIVGLTINAFSYHAKSEPSVVASFEETLLSEKMSQEFQKV